jgi:hypothetical protein
MSDAAIRVGDPEMLSKIISSAGVADRDQTTALSPSISHSVKRTAPRLSNLGGPVPSKDWGESVSTGPL